jgi:uncharacterized protein YciW
VLAEFAELVTRTPASVTSKDIRTLREHALSDCDILDAVEVISYFNYINRIADALGIDPEPEMREAFERRGKLPGRTARLIPHHRSPFEFQPQ